MIFSALLQPFIAFGQEDGEQFSKSDESLPMTSANIFSKLSDELGLNPDLDWGESFGYGEGDEDKVGQDMYMVIYKKVLTDPSAKTLKDVSGKYGLNQGDTWLVLNGDYTPLVDRKPGMTQEELLAKVREMQREYNETKDINQLEANIKAAVEPSEMFANGDLGDSGFDLIHDLNLIEEILFLETSPIDIGKSYTSATGDGLANYGQAPATSGELTAPAGIKTPADPSISVGGGTDTVSESGSGASGSNPLETKSGEGVFNPNACFTESKYDSALNDFEENALTDPNFKDESAGQEVKSGSYSAPGTAINTPVTTKDAVVEDFLPAEKPDLTPVPNAPADDWLKDRYCAGFFCLDVDFVKEPAKSAFENSDNCIACHVEKINDTLKEVINHSLVPTKATGNLGESAECKKAMLTAFGSLSMNVYAIGMPIKTPINDDLMFGTNIDDEWENYCKQVAFFPFDLCETDEDDTTEEDTYEEPVSLTARAATQAAVQAPDEVTQAELSARISEQIEGYEAEQEKTIQSIETDKATEEASVLYQPLKYELERMNRFFKNIQDILHSLHEEVEALPGRQACYDLKNKNECE